MTFKSIARIVQSDQRVAHGTRFILLCLLGCHVFAAETPAPAQSPLTGMTLEQEPMDLCQVPEDGYLAGELFGALNATLDWQGGQMECGGMLRPENAGIRLVFAAPRQDARLLILIGIDGLPADLPGAEHVANVTVIDEAAKRFFSTGGTERCWSTVNAVAAVDGTEARWLQISGSLYCAGSLPSLSDNSFVTLGELRYSGRLELEAVNDE